MTLDVWGRPHLNIRVGDRLVNFFLDKEAGITIVKEMYKDYPVVESTRIQGISGKSQNYEVKVLPLQFGAHTIQEKCAIKGNENLTGASTIGQLEIIIDFPIMCIWQTCIVEKGREDMGLATQTVKSIVKRFTIGTSRLGELVDGTANV